MCFTLPRRVPGHCYAGRNCATQSRMCAAKDSRGYLSARSSTRCILAANCSIASPLGITLDSRKSLSSKRRCVSKSSLRKEKDPDLVRLSTRSPGREAGGAAGASCGGRGSCGREEEDGREEGAAAPLEALLATYEHFRWSSRTALRPLCVVCSRSCPHKSASTEDHRSSQCYPPTQSERADFCWARCCWREKCASWTECLEKGTALSPLSIHHLHRQQPLR
jgi:hypothetical protein